jgi:hypothetical protein
MATNKEFAIALDKAFQASKDIDRITDSWREFMNSDKWDNGVVMQPTKSVTREEFAKMYPPIKKDLDK